MLLVLFLILFSGGEESLLGLELLVGLELLLVGLELLLIGVELLLVGLEFLLVGVELLGVELLTGVELLLDIELFLLELINIIIIKENK